MTPRPRARPRRRSFSTPPSKMSTRRQGPFSRATGPSCGMRTRRSASCSATSTLDSSPPIRSRPPRPNSMAPSAVSIIRPTTFSGRSILTASSTSARAKPSRSMSRRSRQRRMARSKRIISSRSRAERISTCISTMCAAASSSWWTLPASPRYRSRPAAESIPPERSPWGYRTAVPSSNPSTRASPRWNCSPLAGKLSLPASPTMRS